MKFLLFLVILLFPVFFNANAQDTTKVKVIFLTSTGAKVPLYAEFNIGELNREKFYASHPEYRVGTLLQNVFLLNAPDTALFTKRIPIVLTMTDDINYREKFLVYPQEKEQKWMLNLPGDNYLRGISIIKTGVRGMFLSSLCFIAVIAVRPSPSFYYILPIASMSVFFSIGEYGRHMRDANAPSIQQLE